MNPRQPRKDRTGEEPGSAWANLAVVAVMLYAAVLLVLVLLDILERLG